MMRKDAENSDPEKPSSNHSGFAKNLSGYFSEYTSRSSIHGVQYLGEKKRSLLERLAWLIILCTSVFFCAILLVKTYKKWETSPVIVSYARNPTPIRNVPFPAVTICPETKVKQRVYNFTEAYHKYQDEPENMTTEELRNLELASLVCDSHLHPDGNKTVDYEGIRFLSEVAPQFSDVLWQCKWINQNQTCENLLTPVLTEEGVCYTFNVLDGEELFTNVVSQDSGYLQHGLKSNKWTVEAGYPNDAGADTFPRRAIAAGTNGCFSLLMTLYEQDMDYICRGPVQGFKILLHSPTEMPRISQQYIRAPLNQEVIVTVTPNMMTTSEDLRNYDVKRRQCFFPQEKNLKFFKVYTQRNCEIECLANYTLKKCDCVSYHMPHSKDTNLCGAGSTNCVHEAEMELIAQEVQMGIDEENEERCNCLPSCTSLTYSAESSQADFNWQKVFEAYKADFNEFPGVTMSRIFIFFKEQQFITSERSELYSFTDFIASCGGLLAIFMGFSFLSFIEILYFLTLRLFGNAESYGRYRWFN